MSNPIIQTQVLTKRYDDVTAVDKLNLEIQEGEVFGLLGPNGAGKTTTTLMLLGLTEPTIGTAFIDGHDCARDPLAVKRIVGYLPDSVGFYPELTGRENLRFTGRLNGLEPAICERRINELLERVGMTYAADRKAGTYSRGMKQRLGIADVLMKDPKVIIMDEPTLGIDPEGMRELIALIRELSDKDGRTILISSHQLYQVQQICDRVGIFVKGKLIACGRIEELGRQLENEGNYILELQTAPADERLRTLLEELPGVRAVTVDKDGSFEVESKQDIRHEITMLLAQNGYTLLQLRQRGGDLDEIYRKYFEKAGEQDDVTATE
ncbi:MAG: ABC transporter ATP-binding protein, partial [Butyricicoccus sp.]